MKEETLKLNHVNAKDHKRLHEQLHANKLNNLEEMDKSLKI